MNKNPFSLYDFLGYLFPGAILLMMMVFIKPIFFQGKQSVNASDFFSYNQFKVCVYDFDKIKETPKSVKAKKFQSEIKQNADDCYTINKGVLLISFILFSYILGHLVSYFSSQTVEYISNRAYKYPSKYLLSQDHPHVYYNYFHHFHSEGWYVMGPCIWRIIVLIVFFPITLFVFLLGKVFNINAYITRSLDEYLIICIESKIYSLPKNLKVQNPPINLDFDFHRILMHYVYTNIPESQRKADNYVALYGFLRCITFIGCIYFDIIVVLYGLGKVVLDGTGIVEVAVLILLIDSFYMAYLKFYRRFTLENYMALLSDTQVQGYVYEDDDNQIEK
ncbi:MAG TPA: hypothetical protein DCS83_08610 [Prevotella sp.]|nr:hypothetical protein [uncultured Prevotella sp.]HAT62580.1 hypothetical protein [Prevotella sp.]